MRREKFLEGLRVLDLSRLLPGPFTTLRLADMGAEVIKVEDPAMGDYARSFPPIVDGVGQLFRTLNRGKKSLALDFKSEGGRAALLRLVAKSDVLVESYRPGVLAQFGLDGESLTTFNPRLVYCSLTGYGQSGRAKNTAGHDINYLAATGVLDLVGARNAAPCIPGVQFGDLAGAMAASEQIIAALFRRERTQRGAILDVAITDALFAWQAFPFSMEQGGERVERGSFFANGGIVGYNIYETKDARHVALGALEAKFWNRFCDAVGQPGWRDRGTEPAGGVLHADLGKLFASRTWADWGELAATVDCCLTPICRLSEAMASQLSVDRYAFPATKGGTILNSGCLESGSDQLNSPMLGEHNDAIMEAIGYSEEEIESLRQSGVLHQESHSNN